MLLLKLLMLMKLEYVKTIAIVVKIGSKAIVKNYNNLQIHKLLQKQQLGIKESSNKHGNNQLSVNKKDLIR